MDAPLESFELGTVFRDGVSAAQALFRAQPGDPVAREERLVRLAASDAVAQVAAAVRAGRSFSPEIAGALVVLLGAATIVIAHEAPSTRAMDTTGRTP